MSDRSQTCNVVGRLEKSGVSSCQSIDPCAVSLHRASAVLFYNSTHTGRSLGTESTNLPLFCTESDKMKVQPELVSILIFL